MINNFIPNPNPISLYGIKEINMATITGQEAIIRDGKIIGAPIVTAQANKVLVTDGNGAIIGSDVSRQRLSDLGNTFSIVNGKVCITYDDGQ